MDNESFNMISLETSKSFTYFKKDKMCVPMATVCWCSSEFILKELENPISFEDFYGKFCKCFLSNSTIPATRFLQCEGHLEWRGVAWRAASSRLLQSMYTRPTCLHRSDELSVFRSTCSAVSARGLFTLHVIFFMLKKRFFFLL